MNGEQWYEIDDIHDLDIAETYWGISQEHIVMGNGVAELMKCLLEYCDFNTVVFRGHYISVLCIVNNFTNH